MQYPSISEGAVDTTRLHLRQLIIEDFEVLSALWRDEKVRQFLGGIVPDREIETKLASIHNHWNQHGFGLFTVFKKNIKKIIGLCGLHHSEYGIEISYMFFPEFWGKGLATEAALASFSYGFNFLKLEKIIAITQEANQNSCKLLEKINMNYINTIYRFEAAQRVYILTQLEWHAGEIT